MPRSWPIRSGRAPVYPGLPQSAPWTLPYRFNRVAVSGLVAAARERAAEFLGVDPARTAWVRNVSEGVSAVLGSLELHPGDELVISTHGYGAVRKALGRPVEPPGSRRDAGGQRRAAEVLGVMLEQLPGTPAPALLLQDPVAAADRGRAGLLRRDRLPADRGGTVQHRRRLRPPGQQRP
jgi:hypothetical protein